MSLLEQTFIISLLVQTLHSLEELTTGFHKKWYLFKMPFKVFLTLEILFEGFWFAVLLLPTLPYRNSLLAFFVVLMFANGVQHVIWAGSVKKYVPGLATAIVHIVTFLMFYFKVVL